MKKHALIPMSMILIALLAAGCNPQSSPTRGPDGPQGGPTQIINPGGPQDGGPGQGEPQQGGPGVGPGPGGGQPGGVQIDFRADNQTLQPGQCTTLHWNVQGAFNVRLDGQPVDPTGERQVCPKATTTYRLEVDAGDHVEMREVTIQVGGGNPPAPTQKSGGGPGPAATPTVKSGGGGGGSGLTHTPTTSQGYVDIGIKKIWLDNRQEEVYDVDVYFENYGTKKWSKSDDPSSSRDLEFSCSRSWTVEGKINTSTYNGSVPRDKIDDPGEVYYEAKPWYIDMYAVTQLTVSCHITKGPTHDSNSSNDTLQVQLR
jgi:hypothetical protein